MKKQTASPDRFETLIIDNSSRKEGKEAFLALLPAGDNLRYVEFSPLGLSRARNHGLKLTRTPYIAFIDDDAVPKPGWADAVIATFQQHEDVGFVGGPLTPIWPGPQPDWVSPRMLLSLGILDLGEEERELDQYEFVYGANMAFDTAALRQTGGFDTNLGRIGAKSLLSGEEIQVQDLIRREGMHGWYSPAAKVAHRISPHRLRRNWFRSRSAWQAVSDLLADPPQMKLKTAVIDLPERDWSGSFPPRSAGWSPISAPTRPTTSSSRSAPSSRSCSAAPMRTTRRSRRRSAPVNEPSAIALERELATREASGQKSCISAVGGDRSGDAARLRRFASGHGFLFNILDGSPDVFLLSLPRNLWRAADPDGDLGFVERSMTPDVRSITFLTLDFFLRPRHMESFVEFVERIGRPVYGLLHRVPERPEIVERLHKIASKLSRVIVFSDQLRDRLRDSAVVPNAVSLNLFPTKAQLITEDADLRGRLGLPRGPCDLLGRWRHARRQGNRFAFRFARLHSAEGAAADVLPLRRSRPRLFARGGRSALLESAEVDGRVDIRKGRDEFDYAVLSDTEYAEIIAASDFGILLYRAEQRNSASAVLPDYVWLGKRVLATPDSIVGGEVARHDLGLTIAEESPRAVAEALVQAVRMVDEAKAPSARYQAYRDEIRPARVAEAFRSVFDAPA